MRKHVVVLMLMIVMIFSAVPSYAVPDPAVTIVNPVGSSTIYSSNLLISVKIAKPKTIRVKVTEEKKKVNEVLYAATLDEVLKSDAAKREGRAGTVMVSVPLGEYDTYTSSNNLSFYTRKYEKVTPGVYRIRVETLSAGQVVYSSENLVAVREKEVAATNTEIFTTSQSGTTQFLQNLLKTIFGN